MPGTIGEMEDPFGKTLTVQTGPTRIVGECVEKNEDGMFVIKDLGSKESFHLVLPRAEVLVIHN